MLKNRISKVEEIVSKMSDVSIEQLGSRKRSVEIAEARMAIWYICHEFIGLSHSKIARYYNRDHTTILHGVKKMKDNPEQINKIYFRIKEIFPEVFVSIKGPKTLEDWRI